MEKIDKYIKECNLVYTGTNSVYDFCRVDFDLEKAKVNYQNSITLFNLVNSFNRLYISFKKEYETIKKLDLGKYNEVLNFNKFTLGNDNYRNLIIYMEGSSITSHRSTYLYLREINGEMMPFVTSEGSHFDKNYYREDIELDKDISKQYLDLFEKYKVLLDTYKYLKHCFLFGDSINIIVTKIYGNLLNNLDTFNIIFSSQHNSVSVPISLGENFNIKYEDSVLIFDDKEISNDKNTIDKLVKKIYVNKKYIDKK